MHLIWEEYGNTKYNLQDLFWKDCWRPTVTLWMMNYSQHWKMKLNLALTQDNWKLLWRLWRQSVEKSVETISVETISDSKIEIPLSQSNLLTVKRNVVVMYLPGEFSKPDTYSKKKWRRVQYIVGEFRSRWRKEFLQNLQVRQKRKKRIHNCCSWWNHFTERWLSLESVANGKNSRYSCWYKNDVHGVPLRVTDKKGCSSQILRRPTTKLVLLVKNDLDFLTNGTITKSTEWKSICGDPGEVVWYEVNVA